MRLCLISTQPDQLPPGLLLLLLALLASFRVLHLDSHLTKTNKANPNPTITQNPGRGEERARSAPAAPPPPRGRALRATAPQPLTPPGAPPAPALPASFCVESGSPPLRPLGPPQPAHPLPFAPTPQGLRGSGLRRPPSLFPSLRSLLSPTFRPQRGPLPRRRGAGRG